MEEIKIPENDIDYLFEIYKNTFYSSPTKRISLNKINQKLKNKNLNRSILYSVCARFANYLDDNSKEVLKTKKELESRIYNLVQKDLEAYEKIEEKISIKELFDINGIYRILWSTDIVGYYNKQFIPVSIKKGIKELITTSPEEDYPLAREMKRHFILHIGPTNSGKTYQSLERLKECSKGIYLGPLRLLALEVYDKFNRADVPCNMITGEEELLVDGAVCQASTIEMFNVEDYFDIAVIDEAQMISDSRRGYNWTKAILGIRANEVHICMAKSAENIVKTLIEKCGDTYEVFYHERMTPLKFSHDNINFENFHKKLQDGDALIVFSKKSVLAVASELEKRGIKASVIYGNLPPDTRKHQVELFTTGQTKVVVSTDAIGMGLNLPIKRVIFMETAKFDGTERRILNSQEIKQIAGRAGRKGLYDKGFCLAVQDREYIESCLNSADEEIKTAPIGFPETLLSMPYDIKHIIQTWAEVTPAKPFIKMNVKELLILLDFYNSLKEKRHLTYDKETVYEFITCPVDLKDLDVIHDWKTYCRFYAEKDEYEIPVFTGHDTDLSELETYYKRLDLYFQFSRKMKKVIDRETISEYKKETVFKINKILKTTYKDFSKKCNICGRPLPLDYKYGMCKRCFNRKFYN